MAVSADALSGVVIGGGGVVSIASATHSVANIRDIRCVNRSFVSTALENEVQILFCDLFCVGAAIEVESLVDY